MTTENQQPKQKPAFYIFETLEGGKTKNVGAAFPHKTGTGFNVIINGLRYVAFAPRQQEEAVKE